MSDVVERVKKIVVERLEVDADKVVENATFQEDLGADSLDLVELQDMRNWADMATSPDWTLAPPGP